MSRQPGRWLALLILLLLAPAGCSDDDGSDSMGPPMMPERIQVQHVLIGFLKEPAPGQSEGHSTIPGRMITRSKDAARALADRLLLEARAGASFDTLVMNHSEDEFPGIYGISNFGVSPNQSDNEYPREALVPGFGDVGFNLPVGGIDVAEYEPVKSPYGWHVIKRLR
ncbi:MAG: peptidylprolyl isomerase [Candidatus Eisenbacteria bacterium]|nr:peptidylprolyl isomerase [Candidatus Eisenbacteria bacterium]